MSDGSTGVLETQGQLESIELEKMSGSIEAGGELLDVSSDRECDIPSYFDGISPENQQAVRVAEKKLKTQVDIHSKSTLAIGKHACEIKRILGHGRFERWVDAICSCSLATIERCMNAWVRFGHQPDRIAALQKSDLCDLAAPCVPEAFRESILADLDQGRKFVRGEMKREIKTARALNGSSSTNMRSGKVRPKTGSRSRKETSKDNISGAENPLDDSLLETSSTDDMLADLISDKVCDEADEFLRLYPKADGQRVLKIVAQRFEHKGEASNDHY